MTDDEIDRWAKAALDAEAREMDDIFDAGLADARARAEREQEPAQPTDYDKI